MIKGGLLIPQECAVINPESSFVSFKRVGTRAPSRTEQDPGQRTEAAGEQQHRSPGFIHVHTAEGAQKPALICAFKALVLALHQHTAERRNPAVTMATAGWDNAALFLMMKGWKEEKE